MLLVYTHKITPRLTYIFKHIFENMLNIEIGFTAKVDVFVAHSGPKFSYTNKPLGDEFFIASHTLLFEQGVINQNLKIQKWEDMPIFFVTNKNGLFPFDIFASSFFLLTRYEEALPHIKTDLGYFNFLDSIAYKYNFLEKPIIDIWVFKLYKIMSKRFEEISQSLHGRPSKEILLEVHIPYKYLHHSFLMIFGNFFSSIWKINLRDLVHQILVLLRIKKDPYDSFDSWNELFENSSLNPKVFFLFAKNSSYQSTFSIFNFNYRRIIKGIGDYFNLGILASVQAQLFPNEQLKKEKKDFQDVTHKTITCIRFSNGIRDVTLDYENLSNNEFNNDYSMGYLNQIGFRAGTATPYNFYDISNEFQLPLKIHPIFANEKGIKKIESSDPFEKLGKYYDCLPLPCGKLTIVLNNKFLQPNKTNNTFHKGFLDYIND